MRIPTNDWVGAKRRVTIKTSKGADGRHVATCREVPDAAGFANDSKQAVNNLKRVLADREADGSQNWGKK